MQSLRLIYQMVIFLSTAPIVATNPSVQKMRNALVKAWDVGYEMKLIAEMESNLSREETLEEVETVETKQAAPVATAEETIQTTQETTQPSTVAPETSPPPTETIVAGSSEVQPEETTASPPYIPPLYSVNGAVMPTDLQVYLYEQLAVRGIGWFFPYAVLIAYQESKFNIYAENPNGLDKGLFQYRNIYWSYGDIFNPYDQINVFVAQMTNRANCGCDILTMISRHNTSDWGEYNPVYVSAVMQWEPTLIKIQ